MLHRTMVDIDWTILGLLLFTVAVAVGVSGFAIWWSQSPGDEGKAHRRTSNLIISGVLLLVLNQYQDGMCISGS